MANQPHFVVEKYNQAMRSRTIRKQPPALAHDFTEQDYAGEITTNLHGQIPKQETSPKHGRNRLPSSQSNPSNTSLVANAPEDGGLDRKDSPISGLSGVGHIDLAEGNASDVGPSQAFPSNSKKRAQPETNTIRSPGHAENRSIRQSKAAIKSSNNDFWLETIQAPGHQPMLFDANRPSPIMKHDSTPPATTRVYDPRTHIFRSKKTFDTRPGVLPAPEGLSNRPYSVPGPGNKRSSLEFESGYQDYQVPGSFLPFDNFNERDPSLLLQPETRPISQEQLVNEVKGIYAGLVMVEKKCVEIDNQQAQNQAEGRTIKLSHEQWQALIALHRTLLHEHHDFFLASQHPSASPALRKLAAKYAMPARMWRHGIHSFLELLRHRLPDSLDHMLAFIYLAYSMMALLKESVPAFEDTWIECLGDLARYRMAIEDEDLRDREVWSGVARYWYNKAADKSPRIGRIQHHLAVLARPNALQQLFYYTRALTCIQPFLNARESILTLFNPILEDHDAVIHRCLPIDIAFIKAHGILFKQGSLSTFDEHTEKFLSLLDNNIGRVTAKWREQGVWIASSNFFGVLSCVGFGTSDTLFVTLSRILTDTPSRSIELARGIWISLGTGSPQLVQDNRQDSNPQSSEKALVHASYLAFSTLALGLQRVGDKNVLPHVHISLVFLFCVSLVPEVMRFIESYVPWALLVAFLNTLGKPGVKYARVEADTFPLPENAYLPEDFAMRGQVWCQQYHPEGFFGEDCPVDDEERSLEMPSMAAARVERCLYLGIRLCSFNRWMSYDYNTKTFAVSLLGQSLAQSQQPFLQASEPSRPFLRSPESRSPTISLELTEDVPIADVPMVDAPPA